MCSSTRGPASAPSLVTWPTSKMVVPVSLAMRVSCAAHSRTWDTDPGAEVTCSVYSVWIESITTTSGASLRKVGKIASRRISAKKRTREGSTASREARKAICCGDSSPETYNTRRRSPTADKACSNKVDLPIPGSPPMRITAPRTSPPPSTRSSSSMPLGSRGTSSA